MEFETDILKYLQRTSECPKYAIDIGARDGPGPIYHLFEKHGFDGLCIEGDINNYNTLHANLPQTNVNKHFEFVNPNNILSIFGNYNVPPQPAVLKIDIDGYDYFVLETILSSYKPHIIIAEINEKIPPPIVFITKYSEKYQYKGNHFYGFSLQAAYELMNRHGYKVLKLIGGNNVLCVRNELCPEEQQISAKDIYLRDYLHNYPVLWEFPWNANVHGWTKVLEEPRLLYSTLGDIFVHFVSGDGNTEKRVDNSDFVLR
jgi:hypothetical protein